MHLRDSESIQEKAQLDLDTGMIVKIVLACAALGGVIFYLGLTLGQGDALARHGTPRVSEGMKQLEGSLQAVTPPETPSADGNVLMFPSLLARRADQGVERDEVEIGLAHFIPENLNAQKIELEDFRDRILRDKYRLAVDPETGEAIRLQGPAPGQKPRRSPGGAPGRELSTGRSAAPADPGEDEVEIIAAPTPEEEPPPAEEAAEPKTLGRYTIQLQSFRDPEEARLFTELMQERGYHPFVQKVELSGKGTWYRVRLGRFMDMKAAADYLEKFEREQGFSTRIMGL
ncbi:MAG: SPOR domain-containing protein [Deltaproteobacteria bacterium]|nr:SPOR domain-containing protein [Deltaproteobacteria bacterium]